jgi:TatD DNase family protein
MSERVPLADTHCHLCLADFEPDLPEVLERARAAGVERILVPGIDLETSRRAVELADDHEEIFAAVGVHPHHAATFGPATRDELRRLADSPRVVAIGEIGLDYYRDRSPRPAQRKAFEGQLDLAAEVRRPVVVHNREASGDVLERLLPWAALRDNPGVLHAFSSDAGEALAAAEAGLFLGVAGPITYPNAGERRRVTGELPRERILLETDSPYLTPHPHRGRRNEPARTTLIAAALAEIWGIDPDDARRAVWKNAATLFHWDHGTDNRHLL